jgi:hypothetical protein
VNSRRDLTRHGHLEKELILSEGMTIFIQKVNSKKDLIRSGLLEKELTL